VTYFPALRRDYILWRLSTAGEVSRMDVARTFGMSVSMATQDFDALLAEHPVLAYNTTRRRYMPTRPIAASPRLAKLADALEWS
jgi:hypothetical protein